LTTYSNGQSEKAHRTGGVDPNLKQSRAARPRTFNRMVAPPPYRWRNLSDRMKKTLYRSGIGRRGEEGKGRRERGKPTAPGIYACEEWFFFYDSLGLISRLKNRRTVTRSRAPSNRGGQYK